LEQAARRRLSWDQRAQPSVFVPVTGATLAQSRGKWIEFDGAVSEVFPGDATAHVNLRLVVAGADQATRCLLIGADSDRGRALTTGSAIRVTGFLGADPQSIEYIVWGCRIR
jgi:hypothetical protein